MKIKLSLVFALIVASIFPALLFYQWQTRHTNAYTDDYMEKIAVQYLKNAPTFKLYGIQESIGIESVEALDFLTWIVNISFERLYTGYGERSTITLLQVVTSHHIQIKIRDGVVVEAVIDDFWNETSQGGVDNIDEKYTEEYAVKTALAFLQTRPTYIYDGMPETVRIKGVEKLSQLFAWEVFIVFDSRHAGYGDRTGLMSPHIPHEIRIVIQEGEIVVAVLDDLWDELGQGNYFQREQQSFEPS